MIKLLSGVLALTVLGLAAGQARAAVTVLGNGLAAQCSRDARNGESADRYEQVCTLALENEALAPREYAGTLVNRAVMKLRRAEYDAAAEDLDRAIRLVPTLGEAFVNRGAARIGARRFAEGLADTNRGLELGSEEPEKAYYNRALAYEGLDNPKAAYLDYQKAVELSPGWMAPQQELTRFTVVRR